MAGFNGVMSYMSLTEHQHMQRRIGAEAFQINGPGSNAIHFYDSPGTSVTAVGAERGLLQIPGVQENVGLIGIHHNDTLYEVNIKDGQIRWSVEPWGTLDRGR